MKASTPGVAPAESAPAPDADVRRIHLAKGFWRRLLIAVVVPTAAVLGWLLLPRGDALLGRLSLVVRVTAAPAPQRARAPPPRAGRGVVRSMYWR